MKYILAIDQGTTGSRAVIYDKYGKQISSCYKEFTQYFPKPGWVEHDPLEIWESVNVCIQNVLRKVDPLAIAALGITNQRETTVLWDTLTGEPIYNAIVWQCRRTATRCSELKKNNDDVQFFKQVTGLPIDAYFSATKIEWILKNVPYAMQRARNGRLCFGTTDSWLLWKLTGGAVHATDYTNASRTMLFNCRKRLWEPGLLKKFSIPPVLLPQVKRSSELFGTTVKIGKLPHGIPIAGIAGDQQAALFGQTCFEAGAMKNTYGTGSFILLNTGEHWIRSKHGLITTIACGINATPVYALEGSVFIAGAALQWLRDGLKIINHARDSERYAKSLSTNDGVYFVPAFVGLGAPYWDQNARAAFFGITRGCTRNHFVRAALEAICYQTKDVIAAMEADCNIKIHTMKVDGGAVANNFMLQFQADILGGNVVRPKVIETTSLGAAYLAGLAVGFWKDTDDIKRYWKKDRVFTPTMSRKKAVLLYDGWRAAVKRTLSEHPGSL